MDKKNEIYSLLRNKGDRLTQQKKIILSIFINNSDRMLSVNDIIKYLPESESIDNATVYRNVLRFTQLGILESTVDNSGTNKYVLACQSGHHHHMICVSCGKILNIPCQNNYWENCAKDNGFEELYHKLEVYGKCKKCKNLNETH